MADGNTSSSPVCVLLNVSGNSNSTGSFQASQVIRWLTLSIGLPAIGLALYTLKHLSKGGHKVPMHVVFLLISDILSFFGRPSVDEDSESNTVFSSNPTDFIFYFGIVTNITLMLFIAQEHHLLVAYPQCFSARPPGGSELRGDGEISGSGFPHAAVPQPLVDPFIYIFMTKGFKEVMLALPCCHNRRENTSPTVETVAESVETRL
ncbi:5-hydroxytryptamine receptor 4 [Dissostichus eleginoides]|uniref:5-hydroxytryptamine receptor 4 n=1 Tax=Dissostichus eleginoides TaxID=100907 RepID=A0AAD9FJK6_DISEL|nr:5-hydroxytryptamine receptor 4 [Dissostichus eleginoides]